MGDPLEPSFIADTTPAHRHAHLGPGNSNAVRPVAFRETPGVVFHRTYAVSSGVEAKPPDEKPPAQTTPPAMPAAQVKPPVATTTPAIATASPRPAATVPTKPPVTPAIPSVSAAATRVPAEQDARAYPDGLRKEAYGIKPQPAATPAVEPPKPSVKPAP